MVVFVTAQTSPPSIFLEETLPAIVDRPFEIAWEVSGNEVFEAMPEGMHPVIAFRICEYGETQAACIARVFQRQRDIPFENLTEDDALAHGALGRSAREVTIETPGEYYVLLYVAWANDANFTDLAQLFPVYEGTPFTIRDAAGIDGTSPPSTAILQPGTEYDFTWEWQSYEGSWRYGFTYVTERGRPDGTTPTAAESLVSAFETSVDDRGATIKSTSGDTLTFTIPSNVGVGAREFLVEIQTFIDNQPDVTVDAVWLVGVTNQRGDVTGDGCVNIADLSAVADFRVGSATLDVDLQKAFSASDFVRYNVDGLGAVDNDDLIVQASHYRDGCAPDDPR